MTFVFEQSISDDELRQAEILVTYGEDLDDEKIAIAAKVTMDICRISGC